MKLGGNGTQFVWKIVESLFWLGKLSLRIAADEGMRLAKTLLRWGLNVEKLFLCDWDLHWHATGLYHRHLGQKGGGSAMVSRNVSRRCT